MAAIKLPRKRKYLTSSEVAMLFSSRKSVDPCSDGSYRTEESSFTDFWESSEDDSITECSVDDSCFEDDSPSDYSGSPPAEVELFDDMPTHRLCPRKHLVSRNVDEQPSPKRYKHGTSESRGNTAEEGQEGS